MRESAILAILINPQVPDNGSEQDNRGFHEKVTLFLYPGLVQIEHYCISTFVGIGNIRHEFGIDGIAAVAASRIIKIDDIELRFDLVTLPVLKQMIVCDFGQVRKFVIVNVHGKGFLDLLFDVVVYHCITLSRTGRSKHDGGTEGIDDVYPSVPFLALVYELCRQIDGILVLHKPCFLHKTLVGGIEHIFHQIVLQHTANPYTGHKEKDISCRKRYRVYDGIGCRAERQVEHPPVHEKQHHPRKESGVYPVPGHLLIFHSLGTQA